MLSPPPDDTPDRIYLSDLSPKDAPWDARRAEADVVAGLYSQAGYERYSERMAGCSRLLDFAVSEVEAGDRRWRLQAARFCRIRYCPVCQWRRSLMWRARMFKSLPSIRVDYPTARFLFLTLTVRNCELADLRYVVDGMGQAWQRLTKLKAWPALGFIRSLEVTRGKDGSAHPHYHCLLMVKSSYFTHGYIKQAQWSDMWRKSLRVDYTPIVNIKSLKILSSYVDNRAVCETLKYSVKPSDLTADPMWLDGLTKAMHKTRSVTLGGVFKQYLSESDPEDLIHVEDDEDVELDATGYHLFAEWELWVKRYAVTRFE